MRKNMKKYIVNAILAVAALGAVSCTAKFVEMNTNQEQATTEDLSHDGNLMGSFVSQMIANVLPSFQSGENEYGSGAFQRIQSLGGNLFANYEGASNSGFSQNNVYDLRSAGDAWAAAMFNDVYVRAMGPWVQLNAVRDTDPRSAALGDILKVAAMHRVTDSYGPIPYTQLTGGSLTVEYDSQEDVYNAMFQELGDAIDVLTTYINEGGTTILSRFDRVFYGDVTKWVQFANTLRLRLALRVCYADNALYRREAAAAIANPVGFLTENASIHPGSGAWENPNWIVQYSFNDGDSKAGATILCYMVGYRDPRLSAYFTQGSDGQYHGVRVGAAVDSDYPKSALWSRYNCTNSDPVLWMSGAESYFLLAEHYLRQNNLTLAQSYYNDGIAHSFQLWGVSGASAYTATTSAPTAYTDPVNSQNSYSSALSSVSVAWNSQSTVERHLEQIITQKYIAMFPEGQEAWTEFRRTGYPKIIPTATNNSKGTIDTNTQIRRLIYPDAEKSANTANYTEGVDILNSEASSSFRNGDVGGTKLWWDKK